MDCILVYLKAVKKILLTSLITGRQASCQYLLVDIYSMPSGVGRNTGNTNETEDMQSSSSVTLSASLVDHWPLTCHLPPLPQVLL